MSEILFFVFATAASAVFQFRIGLFLKHEARGDKFLPKTYCIFCNKTLRVSWLQ